MDGAVRKEIDNLSNSTSSTPRSSKSLGEPLECYDPQPVVCRSADLPANIIARRRRRPTDPGGYRTHVEDPSEHPAISMWKEHVHVFEYIEREAKDFEGKLKNFWYFYPKTYEQCPREFEEKLLGWCDKYGLMLSYLRGAYQQFNQNLDIAVDMEIEAWASGNKMLGPAKPMEERCALDFYSEGLDKPTLDIHDDIKAMLKLDGPPVILCDVAFTLAKKLLVDVGVRYQDEYQRGISLEEWQQEYDLWYSRLSAFFKMATRLVTHALPYLNGFLPSALLISAELVKEAFEFEKIKVREKKPRSQAIGEMDDTIFGLAMNFVNATAKSICKIEEQFYSTGMVLSEEGRRNRLKARMVWLFFLVPLRREWDRREAYIESLEVFRNVRDHLVISEFVVREVSEIIAKFAECKDTDTFLLDMCRPEDDGSLLYSILDMMIRPKKLLLGDTVAKTARAMGLLCDHACICENPENLFQVLYSFRNLFTMAKAADITAVNRSPGKSTVMWGLSKFWDVMGERLTHQIIGSPQMTHDIVTQYASMFKPEQLHPLYGNYSFCRSLGGFYKWLPESILNTPEVTEIVQTSLERLCNQLCQSSDFKLRWNVAYAVGCCFGNEHIFRAMESYVIDTALVPLCGVLRRSQNFKERIQALLALGKLMRGSALQLSLGYVMESICCSLLNLPSDFPSQHSHNKKFNVEAVAAFCHILSILEPMDLGMLEDVLGTNIEHIRELLKEIESDIPETKLEIVMKAYDRLTALLSRAPEKWPQVEELMTNILGKAVVDRGGVQQARAREDVDVNNDNEDHCQCDICIACPWIEDL